jgi:hypothetical protein
MYIDIFVNPIIKKIRAHRAVRPDGHGCPFPIIIVFFTLHSASVFYPYVRVQLTMASVFYQYVRVQLTMADLSFGT